MTPASVLECSELPKVVGSGTEMRAWMQSGRMNHFSAPFGPKLEPGGAFGSAQLQIEGEILPWVCRCLTSTEVLMGLLGLE